MKLSINVIPLNKKDKSYYEPCLEITNKHANALGRSLLVSLVLLNITAKIIFKQASLPPVLLKSHFDSIFPFAYF